MNNKELPEYASRFPGNCNYKKPRSIYIQIE